MPRYVSSDYVTYVEVDEFGEHVFVPEEPLIGCDCATAITVTVSTSVELLVPPLCRVCYVS